MRIKTKAIRFTAVLALALLVAVPMWAARGKADFTRYVALGDSYGAGVSSNAMVVSHQRNGYVAVLAQQAGAPDFQQPLVSQPGIGPELQLLSIRPLQILPKATTNGVPTNLSLPRPYNNLSIPGARVNDMLTLTGAQPPTNTQTSFAQFILRGLGTAADQILINDVDVNPLSKAVYIAVSRGRGPDAIPVILRTDGSGKITEFLRDLLMEN